MITIIALLFIAFTLGMITMALLSVSSHEPPAPEHLERELDENFCDKGGHFDMEAAMDAADWSQDR